MKQLLQDTKAEGAQMIGVVVALMVSIIVGVLIWYKLAGPMVASLNSGLPLAHAAVNSTVASINASANTIWTLFPIVAIVVIAGIILAIVTNFGRGSGA